MIHPGLSNLSPEIFARKNPKVIFSTMLALSLPGAYVYSPIDAVPIFYIVIIWLDARFYRVGGAKFYKRETSILGLSLVATFLVAETVQFGGVFAGSLRGFDWVLPFVPRAAAEIAELEQHRDFTTAVLRRDLFIVTLLMSVLTLSILGLHWRSYRQQCIEFIALCGRPYRSFFVVSLFHFCLGSTLIALALYKADGQKQPDIVPLMLLSGLVFGASLIASSVVLHFVARGAREKRERIRQPDVNQ
jgi:hypothetical protein